MNCQHQRRTSISATATHLPVLRHCLPFVLTIVLLVVAGSAASTGANPAPDTPTASAARTAPITLPAAGATQPVVAAARLAIAPPARPAVAPATAAPPAPQPPPAGVNPAPPPVMPGWPQAMGTSGPFAPVGVVLADVDHNGDLEVLAGSTDSRFRVWQHDGTLLPGWPQNVGGAVQSKAAVADLDADGDLEILIAVKTGQLRIYHHDGTQLAGWPQATGLTFGFLSPVVYDLDGDGSPEVLIGGGSQVRAWHADGTPVPGFPATVNGTISGTLAVADVAGDPAPEIFAVTTSPGVLYGLKADGTPLWTLPLGLSTSWAAPSIGDVDHDGAREVLVVGYNFPVDSTIFAVRADGSLLFTATYGSDQTYSCPVLGDVDGDGDLELFNAGKLLGGSLYAWDHTGSLLPGWPVLSDPNMEGSAVLADVDGDGAIEIVIGDNMTPGFFYGYRVDGSAAPDFPFAKPGSSGPNAPELGDVDGDGDLDMAMTMGNAQVVLWDFAAPYDPALIEWGGLFHDNWNTNQYGFEIPSGGTGVAAAAAAAGARLVLAPATPNPFNPSTRVTFTLAHAARARLEVHDVQGRRVRRLLDRRLAAGPHAVRWDGRDAGGGALPSGVYWLRLEAGGERRTTGVTLVR